jgi:hypothetical protein
MAAAKDEYFFSPGIKVISLLVANSRVSEALCGRTGCFVDSLLLGTSRLNFSLH